MKKRKRKTGIKALTRVCSLLLTVVLFAGCLPQGVYAAAVSDNDVQNGGETTATQETDITTRASETDETQETTVTTVTTEAAETQELIVEETDEAQSGPVLPDGILDTLQTERATVSEQKKDPEVIAAVNRAIGEVIHDGMTDLQKALALHDWLASHCSYDYTYSNYDGKNALVDGSAVCQGYYEAYKILLDAIGIENGYERSSNHIWNTVKIDGSWYNVDVTWDSGSGGYGGVSHYNFLKSDSKFQENHKSVKSQSQTCTSTTYDSGAFWTELDSGTIRSAMVWLDSAGCYYLKGTCASFFYNTAGSVKLIYRNASTGTETTVCTVSVPCDEYWKYSSSSNASVDPYAKLVVFGTDLYFSVARHIYRVTDGKNLSLYYTETGSQDIYGMKVVGNTFVLQMIDTIKSPNATYKTLTLSYTWQWPEVMADHSVTGFVRRLYTTCLGRSYDSDGANYWCNLLNTGQRSAAEVAWGFFFSDEFKNANYSNEEYVKRLYRTFLGREYDASGLSYWISMLENGMSREYVFRGFAESNEFSQICSDYGVTRGSVTLSAYRDKNVGATGFIARLYTKMLGRSFDEDGLEYWCRLYLTGSKSLEDIASDGFLHSTELQNQNLTDTEFVTRMYETFLNREPDTDGLNYWIARLQNGTVTRDTLVYGFTYSTEFSKLKSSYGL